MRFFSAKPTELRRRFADFAATGPGWICARDCDATRPSRFSERINIRIDSQKGGFFSRFIIFKAEIILFHLCRSMPRSMQPSCRSADAAERERESSLTSLNTLNLKRCIAHTRTHTREHTHINERSQQHTRRPKTNSPHPPHPPTHRHKAVEQQQQQQ